MTNPLRLTRALVDRLPPRTDERWPVRTADPEFYALTAARSCRNWISSTRFRSLPPVR